MESACDKKSSAAELTRRTKIEQRAKNKLRRKNRIHSRGSRSESDGLEVRKDPRIEPLSRSKKRSLFQLIEHPSNTQKIIYGRSRIAS